MTKKNSMLTEMVNSAESIAIGGHVRPDGDCVGSCLGVYLYLRKHFPDKQIHVYLESIPDVFHFLKGSEDIFHEIPDNKVYDLFILLDCGDAKRLGFSAPLYENAKKSFCIDHHVSNQAFATENYIEPDASSTCELVYNLLGTEEVTFEIAECLYVGMVHDTGVFRHSCTHPSTMCAAADLMGKGINFTKIITETFDEKTFAQNQVMGYALVNAIQFQDGWGVASHVDMEQMAVYQVHPKQLDGIVNQLKLTKGADLAVFMYELEKGFYKVSLRSTEKIDVSSLAQIFGGGGHARAAGFGMNGTFTDILEKVKIAALKQLGN